MIALEITATTPHGIVLSRPWGVAFDGLLASVLWHRRKWDARTLTAFRASRGDGDWHRLTGRSIGSPIWLGAH